jgi:hypothetical protein
MDKTCSIAGCNRKAFAKGVCVAHYARYKRIGSYVLKNGMSDILPSLKPKKEKQNCSIPGCNNLKYAKKVCRLHYSRFRKTGSYELPIKPVYPEKCSVEGCGRKQFWHEYCNLHYARLKRTGTLLGDGNKGEKNHFWRGGVAYYPNQTKMKNARKYLLKTIGHCEMCGSTKKLEVHHKDESKTNHAIDNLSLLCHKCHQSLRRGKKSSNSKYIRLYGHTVSEISDIMGLSAGGVVVLHEEGLLSENLNRYLVKLNITA